MHRPWHVRLKDGWTRLMLHPARSVFEVPELARLLSTAPAPSSDNGRETSSDMDDTLPSTVANETQSHHRRVRTLREARATKIMNKTAKVGGGKLKAKVNASTPHSRQRLSTARGLHPAVFLAFRPLLHKGRIVVTCRKDFAELHDQYKPLLIHLEETYTLDDQWKIITNLMTHKVFSSTEAAARWYPDLAHPLPDPVPVEDLLQSPNDHDPLEESCPINGQVRAEEEVDMDQEESSLEDASDAERLVEDGILDFDGPLFQYKAQHVLMTNVQMVLERSCFSFLTKHAPEFVRQEGWESAEQAPLDEWCSYMASWFGVLKFRSGIDVLSADWADLMQTCSMLRNHAVHRKPVPVDRLRTWIINAVTLTAITGHPGHADQLESALAKFDQQVGAIRASKHKQLRGWNAAVDGIVRQRQVLDRKQGALKERLVARDLQHRAAHSDILERSLKNIFAGEFSLLKHRTRARQLEKLALQRAKAAERPDGRNQQSVTKQQQQRDESDEALIERLFPATNRAQTSRPGDTFIDKIYLRPCSPSIDPASTAVVITTGTLALLLIEQEAAHQTCMESHCNLSVAGIPGRADAPVMDGADASVDSMPSALKPDSSAKLSVETGRSSAHDSLFKRYCRTIFDLLSGPN